MLGSCLFLVSSSQVYTFISNHILYLMIIYIDMTHERQRGSYLNFINVVFVVADAIGPLIGASFSEKASWRWLFFFNIPFGPFSALSIYTSCHIESHTIYFKSHSSYFLFFIRVHPLAKLPPSNRQRRKLTSGECLLSYLPLHSSL